MNETRARGHGTSLSGRELMETIFGRRGINCNHGVRRGAWIAEGRPRMRRGRRLCGILREDIYGMMRASNLAGNRRECFQRFYETEMRRCAQWGMVPAV